MTNPLQNLAINYWYKAFTVAGAFFLAVCLTVDIKVASNEVGALFSLGMFFIGLGEWINHPLQTRIGYGLKFTSYNRKACLLGNLFDVLGFLIAGIGGYNLLH